MKCTPRMFSELFAVRTIRFDSIRAARMVHGGACRRDVRGYGRYDSRSGRQAIVHQLRKDPPIYGKVYRESLDQRDYPCTADSYPNRYRLLLERVQAAYR